MNTDHPIYQYLRDRLKACGIAEKENRRTVSDSDGRVNSGYPIIAADVKQDALAITYTHIDGSLVEITEGKRIIPFVRYRLRNPQEYEDATGKKRNMKYRQPAGTPVYPYFPPLITELYSRVRLPKKGRPINVRTLYVVEGELKALAASNRLNLPFIGLGGIQNFRDKNQNQFVEGIREAIFTFKPRNVVLLFDADCLSIKYAEGKELAERLSNFHSAVVSFREMLKTFSVDFYFAHVSTKFTHGAKGIDDLIDSMKSDQIDDIREELESLSVGEKYFFSIQMLGPGSDNKLRKYFLLDSPSSFYEFFRSEIGTKVFVYKGSKYYYDGEKVCRMLSDEIKKFILIDDTYYRRTFDIDDHENGVNTEIIRKVSKAQVFRELNGDKRAMEQIPFFYEMQYRPCPFGEFRQTIFETNENGLTQRIYNKFQPIQYHPSPGNWEHIEKILRHCLCDINQEGETVYEFGLDYIQMLIYQPKVRLPIIVLASLERNTGKSSFIFLLKRIFKENMKVQDANGFSNRFTGPYADKLVVGIDEDIAGFDKDEMQNYIKSLATGEYFRKELKSKDAEETRNYIHLILTTNKESNFTKISNDENRYAVFRVPPLEADDPDIITKCEQEIPAFLFYLSQRKMKYPARESRLHFRTSAYITNTLRRLQDRSRSKLDKELEAVVLEYLDTYAIDECYLTIKDLVNMITESGSFRVSRADLSDYLKFEMRKSPEKNMKYKKHVMNYDPVTRMEVPGYIRNTGTPYHLTRKDFEREEEPKPNTTT